MRESGVGQEIRSEKGVINIADSFTELYEQYMPKVFRYISYRINNTQVAEDLTSGVFAKALDKFTSYRPEKASFPTWLFAIARNTIIDHFRTAGKVNIVSLEEDVALSSNENSPEDEAEEKDEAQVLNACIATLSSREQEIISLKFGAGMNNRQIAKMCGISEANVGIILYRTVHKLRDIFGERENG